MNAREILDAQLAEKRAAEGKPPEPKSRPKRVEHNGDPDVFALARSVSTISVLDRLGIAHDEKFAVCPGCGEDGAKLCDGGGIKCLHDRCSGVGPKGHPGFRSTIDLVMEAERLKEFEAARRICEWNGIQVPERKKTNGSSTPEPPPGRFDDDSDDVPPDEPTTKSGEASHEARPAESPAKPRTLVDIVDRWTGEGPLIRMPTGIEPLDRMSRGGLPVPWRVIVVGAPSAGKTAVSVIIADHLARAAESNGMCVGLLGVDEEPEDLAVRLFQIAGYTLNETEARDGEVLARMRRAVVGLRVRLYDDEWTIESAGADLANWAKAEGRMAALFLDSLHAVRSFGSADAKTPREGVDANVRAMRGVSTRLRLLVVASAEANRASYRTDDAAETTNDLAAGAESRAVEFGAQTQLMLRTPKDHPNVIHVRVAKKVGPIEGRQEGGVARRARHRKRGSCVMVSSVSSMVSSMSSRDRVAYLWGSDTVTLSRHVRVSARHHAGGRRRRRTHRQVRSRNAALAVVVPASRRSDGWTLDIFSWVHAPLTPRGTPRIRHRRPRRPGSRRAPPRPIAPGSGSPCGSRKSAISRLSARRIVTDSQNRAKLLASRRVGNPIASQRHGGAA